MNYSFLKTETAGQASNSRLIITKQAFFNSDDHVGYFDKENFSGMMSQMQSAAPRLFKQYRDFFNCLQEGFTITSGITKNKHQTNLSDYYYVQFESGKLKIGVTIYDVERIGQFIKDYALGVIETNFSLEELLEEARN